MFDLVYVPENDDTIECYPEAKGIIVVNRHNGKEWVKNRDIAHEVIETTRERWEQKIFVPTPENHIVARVGDYKGDYMKIFFVPL